ncbi:peptidase M17 [Aliidiomarina minuta]|uniref:Probable cytosol aminopeptidase n=1 Tax=Aliidiomarina minuta TaxID=880057 RepID=A0A432W9M9_9GAMM|nr:leucyl aminopeptidase [Aliidiomarina minuta]RUO26857.1 peptidase M17 [Aliidiomarina minuta]
MKLVRSIMLGAALALSSTPLLANSYLNTNVAFTQQADQSQADTIVILVPADTDSLNVGGLDRETKTQLERAMQVEEFKGGAGSILEVLAPAGSSANRILLLGVGDLSDATRVTNEKAGAELVIKLNAAKSEHVVLQTGMLNAGRSPALMIAQIAHGMDLRGYHFDRYKSDAEERNSLNLTWNATEQAEGEYKRLEALARGVFLARQLVDEPGSNMGPKAFIERVRTLEDMGVEITVLSPEQVEEMGMGAMLSVGLGSVDGAWMLAMHWKGSDEAPLALVGKGNTFDTGGYSIKTGGGMRNMKTDKAGGAAVAGAMKALAGQNAPVNVVGIVPLTMNMINEYAALPGDIITAGNGKTIEINNTDAEGRMGLADGLWYAETEFSPRAIVDIATLTGAKVGAVGTAYSAVFSDDERMLKSLQQAGDTVDELVWHLPMHESYMASIRSNIADLINGGSPGASAGAMFLREFVEDTPWAHVDMAGNALLQSASGIHPTGATGYGVRLLVEWVNVYSQGE